MGDYSRDTYSLTNAVHQLLTGQAVTNPRHYVGVRMQQGVPVLDADWNELEDIRNMELRAVLRYFIGNGVPASNAGFAISESGIANDFAIGPGVALFDGMLAINLATTTYGTQPGAAGLPPLTTPGGGADRDDVAYLDLWHEEARASGGGADDRLVNPQIGLETAVRTLRRWQVRVREGATDLAGLPVPAGHFFLPLALLRRRAAVAAIRDTMIEDSRRPGLTLSEHLKVPLYLRRGLEVLDVQRFVQMAKGMRTVLFTRLKNDQIPYQTAAPDAPKKETLILMALEELRQLARLGEIQAASRNFDNQDALAFMNELYGDQKAWIDLVQEIGNDANVAQAFITDYRKYLDGNAAALIKGLKPALDQGDLLASVIAQEALNFWLTAPIGELPEGGAAAVYRAVIPVEPLAAGSSYEFTYRVSVNFVSPQTNEDFQVQVTLPAAFGTASADPALLTFTQPEGEAEVVVTVVPSGTINSAELDVAVFAVRNATLRSSQPGITLTLSSLPPVGAFFYYIGPRFNTDGQLAIPQSHLTRSLGRDILFKLRNDSTAETRTYRVTRLITPNVGDPAGWSPLTATALADIVIPPLADATVFARVDGPKSPSPAPAIGTTGTITAVATMILVDGTPPADPPAPISIIVPFVVVPG